MSGVFDVLKVPIFKLVCGGMHTVALASSGAVYTWGCNDEGALGRSGLEDKPMLVQNLPIRCTDISAGDSHSVFYNTENSNAYFCGLYRVRNFNKVINLIDRIQLVEPFANQF
jgi:regulator of chromosome condensation